MSDKLKIFVTKYDEKLYLNDKTDYPIEINGVSYNRDNFAIGLHYSYNDFELGSTLDLFNDSSVAIKSGSGDIISMEFYLIPIFSTGPYGDKQVVYHEDVFYSSNRDNNMTIPSPLNEYWTVLNNNNGVMLLKQNVALGYPVDFVEMYSDVPITEPYTINKLIDKEYEIIDNTGGANRIKAIELWDYEDNFIRNIDSIFRLEIDGVYKVKIVYNLIGDDDPVPDEPMSRLDESDFYSLLIVTHVDDIECCYKRIVQSLYCDGSDYCLDESCFQKREMENNINEISNIYHTLIMDMKVSRMKFFNIMPNIDTKEKYVQEVGRLIKIVRLIVDECKDCCDGSSI